LWRHHLYYRPANPCFIQCDMSLACVLHAASWHSRPMRPEPVLTPSLFRQACSVFCGGLFSAGTPPCVSCLPLLLGQWRALSDVFARQRWHLSAAPPVFALPPCCWSASHTVLASVEWAGTACVLQSATHTHACFSMAATCIISSALWDCRIVAGL
jgi:hypothetical protein